MNIVRNHLMKNVDKFAKNVLASFDDRTPADYRRIASRFSAGVIHDGRLQADNHSFFRDFQEAMFRAESRRYAPANYLENAQDLAFRQVQAHQIWISSVEGFLSDSETLCPPPIKIGDQATFDCAYDSYEVWVAGERIDLDLALRVDDQEMRRLLLEAGVEPPAVNTMMTEFVGRYESPYAVLAEDREEAGYHQLAGTALDFIEASQKGYADAFPGIFERELIEKAPHIAERLGMTPNLPTLSFGAQKPKM